MPGLKRHLTKNGYSALGIAAIMAMHFQPSLEHGRGEMVEVDE